MNKNTKGKLESPEPKTPRKKILKNVEVASLVTSGIDERKGEILDMIKEMSKEEIERKNPITIIDKMTPFAESIVTSQDSHVHVKTLQSQCSEMKMAIDVCNSGDIKVDFILDPNTKEVIGIEYKYDVNKKSVHDMIKELHDVLIKKKK